MKREQIASFIVARLEASSKGIAAEFRLSGRIQSAVIDGLLPQELAQQISLAFPAASLMHEQKSLREHKFSAKDLHNFSKLVEEAVFAFQDPRVLAALHAITGIKEMQGDSNLYAGGISLMQRGHFLLPHLDNSHDKDRKLYRVLNLLYYVSPGWTHESGGNFELWDQGPAGSPREIVSSFNRLVLMATHRTSWHSVSQVRSEAARACISNYYYSPFPMESHGYFHVTSFRARPRQRALDLVLRADSAARNALRSVFKKGILKPDVFSKPEARMH